MLVERCCREHVLNAPVDVPGEAQRDGEGHSVASELILVQQTLPRSHQRSSEVIRGHQSSYWSSRPCEEVIVRSTRRYSVASTVALSGTRWHSVALGGTKRHSEALRGIQWHSPRRRRSESTHLQ